MISFPVNIGNPLLPSPGVIRFVAGTFGAARTGAANFIPPDALIWYIYCVRPEIVKMRVGSCPIPHSFPGRMRGAHSSGKDDFKAQLLY
jgi:hypothetical protein